MDRSDATEFFQMNARMTFAAMAVGLTMAAGAAQASTVIAGLYNTGVDNSYVSTTGTQVDQHWTLALNGITPSTAYNDGVNGIFPLGPWLAEDATSRWVGPTNPQGASTDPLNDGFYEYSLTFNLTAAQASGASFVGRYAADNAISWVKLNTTVLDSTLDPDGLGGFTSWSAFGASTPAFQAGTNTLAFRVINYSQDGGNPSGLRVEFTGATVGVPEPASWALMIGGFGMAGAMLRRRRQVAITA
jgi:hypothetical protein